MALKAEKKRELRAIGHKLKPVVIGFRKRHYRRRC